MPLTRQDETELLTALHEGLFEQPLWSTFLQRLLNRTEADYVYMLLHRAGAAMTDATGLFLGKRPSPELRQRYRDELHRFDPLPYHQMRPNRVYNVEEILDPDNAAHARYRREFLSPGGMNHMRLIRVTEPGGASGWLVVSREKRDLGAAVGALLGALAPHFAIALRSFATIGRERFRADLSADAVRRLNFGWMTLDAAGHVIDLDPQAERLLKRSAAMRRTPRGRLLLAAPQAERALSEAIRVFADPGRAPRPQAIHLCDEPWLDMLLLPVGDRDMAGQEKPALVAYVHGEERSTADRRDQLVDLFGLSLGEAGLALALSRGRSIAEAAGELGLTVETARNYSKRIYAKTGTRGQADLVRLILASVVALA